MLTSLFGCDKILSATGRKVCCFLTAAAHESQPHTMRGKLVPENNLSTCGKERKAFAGTILFKVLNMSIITWLKFWLQAREIRKIDRRINAIRHARFYRG